MKVLNVLLFPFAFLYRIATDIRNHLYNIGHKRSIRFQVPVISVGNLNTGGSGKTPAIEYLVRLLKDKYKIVTLSRGYGRRTRGLRIASDTDNATSLGDEPFQFFRNFGSDVKVAVGEDRAFAIPNILQEYPETEVILLDDAFQHRNVNPHYNILLTSFNKPFFKDHLLPMGRLRESRRGARRADIIVVTKCNSRLTDTVEKAMGEAASRYAPGKPVFYSEINYSQAKPFWNTSRGIGKKIILVSGIANADHLVDYVNRHFEIIRHFKFRDHHRYTPGEVALIVGHLQKDENVSLLTTEKDMVRLIDPKFEGLNEFPCFYLPIEMSFVKNGSEFDKLVMGEIEKALASAGTPEQ